MTRGHFQRWTDRLKGTPFHPQWLLGSSKETGAWIASHARGLVLDVGAANRWVENQIPSSCCYVSLDYPATGRDLYGSRPELFADAAKIPIRDKSVDVVLLLEVLEHLRYPSDALKEIHRVLRPGGKLIMSVPFMYPLHDPPFDFQRYTTHGLERELEKAGLQIDTIEVTIGSIETAGMIANLAIGGSIIKGLKSHHSSLILSPFLIAAIFLINLTSWTLAKILPNWSNLTAGYRVESSRAFDHESI